MTVVSPTNHALVWLFEELRDLLYISYVFYTVHLKEMVPKCGVIQQQFGPAPCLIAGPKGCGQTEGRKTFHQIRMKVALRPKIQGHFSR